MKPVVKGKRTNKPQLGFYGCVGQVVCIRMPDSSAPRNIRIQCPACGHTHSAQPFWRKVMKELDKGRDITTVEDLRA